MSVAEYLPGGWTAAVRPGFVALVSPLAPPRTARGLWAAADDGLVACLGVIAHDGFAGLPSFALVHVDGGRAHLALRGDVAVHVSTADGTRVVRSGDVGTWSEQVVDDVLRLSVVADASAATSSDAEDDDAARPLADGVVTAGAVRLVVADAPEPDPGTSQDAEVRHDDAPVAYPPLVAAPPLDEPVSVPVPAEATAPPAPHAPLVADAPAGTSAEPLGAPQADPLTDPLVVVPADARAEDLPAAEPEDAPPAEPAPAPLLVKEPVADVPLPHEPVEPAAPFLSLVPDRADDALLRAAPEDGAPAGLVPLGDVPAEVESTVDDVRTLVGPASPDDHDGMTILSSDLAQIREQLPAWAAQWPDEGATPGPFAVPTTATPEHPAARIVLSTGLDVTLDRTVLLGRAPQVARVTNRELPRLVAVPSPQQDISRTHAEVRAEGDHVLVTDLHSTNGVHVSRPGEGARRLHPGEPSVVAPGETVDLGDGVTFVVERGL